MKLREGLDQIGFEGIVRLYDSVGWTVYTRDPAEFRKALENSSFVVACIADETVIGLARSISDDVSIHYLQDILIDPAYQRKGIGRKLIERCLERYAHVRTHVILTDDEERQRLFYESSGFKNTRSLTKFPLNVFVKMNHVDLQ